MASIFDVARYILEKQNEMTAMKLQKLAYYCQAWHLVWADNAIFDEAIEAWINGPVVPELYKAHQGKFKVTASDFQQGDSSKLSENEKDSIDIVVNFYGDKTSQWLSDLTHEEDPWRQARIGLSANERGNHQITLDSMYEYYSSLQ